MASISIESKPVFIGTESFFDHLYLVYKDDQGKETVVRAGPGAGGVGLVVEIAPMAESTDTRDADTPEDRGARLIDFGERDPADVWQTILIHANTISQANMGYGGLTSNSNSFITSLLHVVDIDVNEWLPTISGIAYHPGTGNILDSINFDLQGQDQSDVGTGDSLVGGSQADYFKGFKDQEDEISDRFVGGAGDDEYRISGKSLQYEEAVRDPHAFYTQASMLEDRSASWYKTGLQFLDIIDDIDGGFITLDFELNYIGTDFGTYETIYDLSSWVTFLEEDYIYANPLGLDLRYNSSGEFGGISSGVVIDFISESGSVDQYVILQAGYGWYDQAPVVAVKLPSNAALQNAAFSSQAASGPILLAGSAFSDELLGGDGDDQLMGADGADELSGGAGSDYLDGGSGNDIVNGEVGADYLFGGNGDDEINGGDGNDSILGGIGDDYLVGGDGDDHLEGGDGADILFAGAGDDVVIADMLDLAFDGGLGLDTLIFRDTSDFIYSLDEGSFENIKSGTGNDTIYGNATANRMDGGSGDDFLQGFEGDDYLVGGTGADTLLGGDGDDRVVIDGDDDYWEGGAGHDTLVFKDTVAFTYALAQGGFEDIESGSGDDNLYGDELANRMSGGEGDDNLQAGGGNDVVDGGQGENFILLGEGADTIVKTYGSGWDYVGDFQAEYDAVDLTDLYYWNFSSVEDALSEDAGLNHVYLDLGDGNGITFENVRLAQLSSENFYI